MEKVRRILSGQPEKTLPTLADVRLVITDVDGVLTDGGLYYTESGESIKRFHARDGLGIRLLIESGVHVAVVSGRDSSVLRKRLNDLGINHSILGVKDKAQACSQIMQDLLIDSTHTLFVGDDSIDLPAFTVCGFSAAVADAPDYIQSHASIKLTQNGGQGAFRELADKILLKKNKQRIYETANGFLNAIKNTQQ
ncbi:MAG: KdsC family phosphatase [Plesiomonas sp.]